VPKWPTRRYTPPNRPPGDSFTDINGGHPTRGAQMSDVQSGGLLTVKPKRKAKRVGVAAKPDRPDRAPRDTIRMRA